MVTKNEEETVEEDWSSIRFQTTNEQNGSSEPTLHSNFLYYDTLILPLHEGNNASDGAVPSLKLKCMKRLTPLDMLDLSNGVQDSTGNRIWMGAIFFLECMVRPLPEPRIIRNNYYDDVYHMRWENTRRALGQIRQYMFHNKNLLELGAGTGVSLIAIGLAGKLIQRYDNNRAAVLPRRLTFTDNDETVLSLCRVNCELNLDSFSTHGTGGHSENPPNYYEVLRLDWGELCEEYTTDATINIEISECGDAGSISNDSVVGSQDCVVATDVIYHLSTIDKLFKTASLVLSSKKGGIFVLAHVPRADIECEPSKIRHSLEAKILEAASVHGFSAATSTLRGRSAELRAFVSALQTLSSKDHTTNEPHDVLLQSNTPFIIRPSSLMNLWTDERFGSGSQNKTNETPISFFSSDYEYEELESCGASVFVFIKECSQN